jgi:hypothetical protein
MKAAIKTCISRAARKRNSADGFDGAILRLKIKMK